MNLKKFPIVGVGSSAGGLEALEQLFRNTPENCGFAFVLVSHLSPDHVSMLSEILQRVTKLTVLEAQDQMQVLINHVYTIPPNRDMGIFKGKLQLSIPIEPHSFRLPIDQFFESLAFDQGNNAIGIILSGTGTDGTLGLRYIIESGGFSMVQESASAKYDGMTSSAINAGYANFILPVEEMSTFIITKISIKKSGQGNNLPISSKTNQLKKTQPGQNDLNQKNLLKKIINPVLTPLYITKILMYLRTATGQDFSLYKKSTIGRRIERRMLQHNLEIPELYVHFLEENPSEVHILCKELLINVTNFFRDKEAFKLLQQEILPELCKGKLDDYVFRVWVAGCATGEEAYSIAILLRELQEQTQQAFKIQIYATDLDDDAIAIARAGIYSANLVLNIEPERLQNFFLKEESGYRIKKEIREMVVFAVHNLIKDPPFTKLDLLSCRNLMIYLEPELQNQLIPIFHYSLKENAVLFLSPSESVGSFTELFTAINRKWKFYKTIHTNKILNPIMHSPSAWIASNRTKALEDIMMKTKDVKTPNFEELTHRLLVQYFAPASVIVNFGGDIVYVYGETGKYLRPAPGIASLNIAEMAREGLAHELRTAINLIVTQGLTTINQEIIVKTNGDFTKVSLSVRPFPKIENSDGNQYKSNLNDDELLLISFQDVAEAVITTKNNKTAKPTETRRLEEMERELAFNKESSQATIIEQQTFNEELRTTNEELQSTNEELQSTNEELETSKEELQSVNEELITVNAELQSKIEQLASMQNDMKNLHDSINIGTIFLDQHMQIRRFSRDATKIFRLVQTDLGRPLADIKSDFISDANSDIKVEEELIKQANNVLETLVSFEREVTINNGDCYLLRIQPYRTLDNIIEGVVLTFTNISQRIKAEAGVRNALAFSENLVDTIREPLLLLDKNLQIVSANRAFCQYFQVNAEDTLGRKVYDLGNRQWNIPALRELLETILPRDQSFEGYLVEHKFPIIGQRKILLNARCIDGKLGEPSLILLAMEEVGSKHIEAKSS